MVVWLTKSISFYSMRPKSLFGLSVILNEEPDEEQVANFYKINETP